MFSLKMMPDFLIVSHFFKKKFLCNEIKNWIWTMNSIMKNSQLFFTFGKKRKQVNSYKSVKFFLELFFKIGQQ